MGFPVPLKEWMQDGPVKEFVSDILLSQKVKPEVFIVRRLSKL